MHDHKDWSQLGDDDYTLFLYPSNGGLLTSLHPEYIEVEFDSDEAIDHFGSQWWNTFHTEIDMEIRGSRPGCRSAAQDCCCSSDSLGRVVPTSGQWELELQAVLSRRFARRRPCSPQPRSVQLSHPHAGFDRTSCPSPTDAISRPY